MPNGQSVDTPTDMSIRQDQLRIRKEMGQQKSLPPIESTFSKPYTFRFRKHMTGSFASLWELAVLDKTGRVEELIIDADALPNALEAVGNIFANQGL